MKLTLMNYDNKKADIEIPDTGLISIYISVISGDEIAIVNYQDGDMKVYDSAILVNEVRLADFMDGTSCLYKATWSDEKKAEKMATFNNRANSYDWD